MTIVCATEFDAGEAKKVLSRYGLSEGTDFTTSGPTADDPNVYLSLLDDLSNDLREQIIAVEGVSIHD